MIPNLDKCIEQLRECKPLAEQVIVDICDEVKNLLIEEPNILQLSSPITVVGDIHGQFWDLLELFRIGGDVPDTNYLFLGDYVDRGYYCVETISLLVCMKLRYPNRVHLLRGNHESRGITMTYGFYEECGKKYNENRNVWLAFMELFDCMTIAAVIDGGVFAVHGGLSPSIHTLDQVRVIDRFVEIPMEGPMADLIWSDPDENIGGFSHNQRGVGYLFGADMVGKFIWVNNIAQIVRAHQMVMSGYRDLFENTVSTVWSAPNYCYRCGNDASILEIDQEGNQFVNTFQAAPESERKVPDPDKPSEAPNYFL